MPYKPGFFQKGPKITYQIILLCSRDVYVPFFLVYKNQQSQGDAVTRKKTWKVKVDSSSQEFPIITNMSDLFSRRRQVRGESCEMYIVSD